jgi:hypothetical protein
MDNPTKHILYEITPPITYEGIDKRMTPDEVDALVSYNRGFIVEKHEIVEAYTSTGQKVITTLVTKWRGK